MKYIFLIPLLYLMACNDSSGNIIKDNIDTDVFVSKEINQAIKEPCDADSVRRTSWIWYTDFDKHGSIVLKKGYNLNEVKSIDSVIVLLNRMHDVKIEKIKAKKDTVYIRIINDTYFTQKIGNTGAAEFILSTIYTLTDHFGYRFVHFQFKEGDHGGQPGLRDRKNHYVEAPSLICD